MPFFDYQARTQGGEVQMGTVEAGSREAAIETLQRHELFITKLRERRISTLSLKFNFRMFRRVAKKDLVIFSRQLSALFGAHVPLLDALRTLAEQTANQELRRIIDVVATDIDGGMAFSDALAKHPKVFSQLYVSIVHSGEISGKLQEVLEYIAKTLEREYHLVSRVRGALVYPAIVLIAFTAVFIFMVTVILPQIEAVFKEGGQQLPFLTRAILTLAAILRRSLIPLAVLAIPGGFFFARYIGSAEGSRWWDHLLLKTPVAGFILSDLYITRMADNLGTLITSGIPITEALAVAGSVVGNAAFRDILKEAEEAVKRGEQIHGVLRSHPKIIPPIVTQMVAVGEKTGELDQLLGNIASFYQQEVDAAVDNLVSLIEPILILVLGGAVGILVVSIILPIYNLAGSLQ